MKISITTPFVDKLSFVKVNNSPINKTIHAKIQVDTGVLPEVSLTNLLPWSSKCSLQQMVCDQWHFFKFLPHHECSVLRRHQRDSAGEGLPSMCCVWQAWGYQPEPAQPGPRGPPFCTLPEPSPGLSAAPWAQGPTHSCEPLLLKPPCSLLALKTFWPWEPGSPLWPISPACLPTPCTPKGLFAQQLLTSCTLVKPLHFSALLWVDPRLLQGVWASLGCTP